MKRVSIMTVAILAVAAASVTRAQDSAEHAPPTRVEVPLREVRLSNGTRRYAVPIRVGGLAMDAGLDTGSVGLRVLDRAIAGAQVEQTSHSTTYSYAIGTRFKGVVAHADVGFGTLSGPATIDVIEKIDCRPDKPACPAAHADPATFGVQGDGLAGEGFPAILGINMGDDEVANPLSQLGVKRWIVDLPKPGDTAPGKLILNPTADEMAGFVMLPIVRGLGDSSGGAHDAVDGCLRDLKSRETVCGALMLDSGAPGIRVVSAEPGKPWPEGDPAQIVFVKDGKPALVMDFAVDRRDEASHFATEEDPQMRVPHLYTGLTSYFAFDVLYDPQHGQVGLKPR